MKTCTHGLSSPSSGVSADAQSVPILNSTARYSKVQYSKVPKCVTDSTPDSSDSVAGGGGRDDTDSTVPLTRDVSVESEPICKASLVPTVGTMQWHS